MLGLASAFPAGTYKCGFFSGGVEHTATAELAVALLPDDISLKIHPLSVDCTLSPASVLVHVTASIYNSSESFLVWWSYMGVRKGDLSHKGKTNIFYRRNIDMMMATKLHLESKARP